jgi:hypothetical protein
VRTKVPGRTFPDGPLERHNRESLDRGDLRVEKILSVDHVGGRHLALRPVCARDGDVDLAGVDVADIRQVKRRVMTQHPAPAGRPQSRLQKSAQPAPDRKGMR